MPAKTLTDTFTFMRLIQQGGSDHNRLYVFEDEGKLLLKIRHLTETHSIYRPDDVLIEPLEDHYWNFMTILPYLLPMKKACLIGLGAGTITRQIATFHPYLKVDGVEIDPGVIRIGAEHFNLMQPNLTVHQADGISFIKNCCEKYDLIMLDAFEDGNLSWAFINQGFIEECKKRLNQSGILAVNYIEEQPLARAVQFLFMRNLRHAWLVPVANSANHLLIGSCEKIDFSTARYKGMPSRLIPLAEYMSRHAISIPLRQESCKQEV